MASIGIKEAEPEAPIAFGSAYRGYVLFLVVIGFALNFVDRQIVSVLLQPIKQDLHLSDTWLGFLSGLAFALFYATLGLPIARRTDFGSRRIIMTVSVAIWSAMTMLCGFAQNFWQLMAARFGVGIGEAGFTPAAITLVTDYFPKERRTTAIAIANIGPVLGVFLGFLIGGVVLHHFGWRVAFMFAGAPGMIFALVFFLTVREPRLKNDASVIDVPPLLPSIAEFWRRPAFRYLMLGCAFFSFCSFGMSTWVPSLLARSYGMSPATVGVVLAPVLGISGGLGTFLGGYITEHFMRHDMRWALWVPSIAAIVAMPIALAAFMSPTAYGMIGFYAVAYFLGFAYVGPAFSMIQELAPQRARALATAWVLFLVNLIGLGIGPQVIGLLSDAFSRSMGLGSLRVALLFGSGLYFIPALLFGLSSFALPKVLRQP